MKIGEHKIVESQCPFCKEKQYKVERWGDNLFLLTCLNKNCAISGYYKLNWVKQWKSVDTK